MTNTSRRKQTIALLALVLGMAMLPGCRGQGDTGGSADPRSGESKYVVIWFAQFEHLYLGDEPHSTIFGIARRVKHLVGSDPAREDLWNPANEEFSFRSRNELALKLKARELDVTKVHMLRAAYTDRWIFEPRDIPPGYDTVEVAPEHLRAARDETEPGDVALQGTVAARVLPPLPDGDRVFLFMRVTRGLSLTAGWPSDLWTSLGKGHDANMLKLDRSPPDRIAYAHEWLNGTWERIGTAEFWDRVKK